MKTEDLFGTCPYITTEKLLSGKRSMMILYVLSQGTHRFNELNKKLMDMSRTTLSAQLRFLEKTGLVERIVYPEIPPRVEYKLSDLGKEFEVVLESVNEFGKKYINYLNEEKKAVSS